MNYREASLALYTALKLEAEARTALSHYWRDAPESRALGLLAGRARALVVDAQAARERARLREDYR